MNTLLNAVKRSGLGRLLLLVIVLATLEPIIDMNRLVH